MTMDRVSKLGQRGNEAVTREASPLMPAQSLHPLLALQRAAGNAAVGALLGRGQPLPAPVREEAEARFGHDFGGVRIHTGPRAVEAASAIGARAFTAGA